MGNEVWPRVLGAPDAKTPVFGGIAKARSDGFTARDGGVHDWTTKDALKSQLLNEKLFSLELGKVERDPGNRGRVLHHPRAGAERGGVTPFTDVQADDPRRAEAGAIPPRVDKYLGEFRRTARIWTVYTGPVSADVLLGLDEDGQLKR